jgi:site-specific recombinase XerC
MKPLTVQALESLGKNWSVSGQTREARIQHVKEFAKFVSQKFHLEAIANLKPGHVEAYVGHLVAEGLSKGTVCNRMAGVRDLAAAVGKANIVHKDNKSYGTQRGCRQKPILANQTETDRIRTELALRANSGDRVAMMCHAAAELRDAFGLRAKESLMSSKLVETERGVALQIEGAKGGRPRDLPIKNDSQLHAVRQVAAVSKELGSTTGRIIPPEMSLKQAYNAQRTLWAKLGGSRANNSHMHAARHTVAQDMYERGCTKGEIMTSLGHGENRSPFCYIPKG